MLETPQEEQALARPLPPGLVLRSTRQQSSSLEHLIRSYQLNLNALSLMASFVAVFIVYNSMLISVQQRVTSLGILRCLGGSRLQLGGDLPGRGGRLRARRRRRRRAGRLAAVARAGRVRRDDDQRPVRRRPPGPGDAGGGGVRQGAGGLGGSCLVGGVSRCSRRRARRR